MFFKDTNISTNITAATPERVYALCKCIERKKSISNSDLRSLLEPDYAHHSNYYTMIRDVALDLGLIENNDFISLKVDSSVIKSIEEMRKYINNNMDQYRHGMFYAITSAYYNMGTSLFREVKNVATLSAKLSNITGMTITDVAMRAWRFWASFLGFGYLDSMLIIPNATVFMRDLIIGQNIRKKEFLSADEFFSSMEPALKIIVDSSKRTLNYGTTSALLTLVQMNVIEITEILDHDVWNLEKIDPNRSQIITHIKVKK